MRISIDKYGRVSEVDEMGKLGMLIRGPTPMTVGNDSCNNAGCSCSPPFPPNTRFKVKMPLFMS